MIEDVLTKLRVFRDNRDWSKFHNPKDLALAISIEASELNELFLWKNSTEANPEAVADELADIFLFALYLADHYNFNIIDIMNQKIAKNEVNYPVSKSRGVATKHTDL